MRRVLTILLMALLLAGCRRELEVMEPQKTQLRLDIDWMGHFGSKPNGMTVMIWGDGWAKPFVSSSNNVESMPLELDPGHYRLIVFNKSFDEFGSLKFTDTASFEDIAVRGTDITQYVNGEWDKGITYMPDPEDIGVAVDEFTITENMLLDQVTFYPYKDWIKRRYAGTRWMQEEGGVYSTTVEVRHQLSRLNVWVHVKGIENMSSMVGNISGMADGIMLSQVWRTTDDRYMLLDREKWTVTSDADNHGKGLLSYSVPVFGLPHGKELVAQRQDDSNVLTLNASLIDGTSRTYVFNVAKAITYHSLEGKAAGLVENDVEAAVEADIETSLLLDLLLDLQLDLEIELELPHVEPKDDDKPSTSSGFDAHVDPWDDGGTVDIGL